MKTVEDLVVKGTLKFAREPKDNPDNLDSSNYVIPLIEHDYPAKTPVMWNAVYNNLGLPTRNIMLVGNPGNLPDIFDIFRQDLKYLGGGAGVGFKDEAVRYLDEFEPIAKEIGAINFILKTNEGKLKGFNTDGIGYAQSLEEVFDQRKQVLRGKKVVVLGAGGASNAVAFALAERGAKLVILNRTIEKAENLVSKINNYFNLINDDQARFGSEDAIVEEVRDAEAIVNVSTKGSGELAGYSALAPVNLPSNEENIRKNLSQALEVIKTIPEHAIISDIVLGKELTPLLKSAKEAGFEILDGIPMVINQGVEAFWLLHQKELMEKGISKDEVAEIMRKAARS